jgi:hypothetical protein
MKLVEAAAYLLAVILGCVACVLVVSGLVLVGTWWSYTLALLVALIYGLALARVVHGR